MPKELKHGIKISLFLDVLSLSTACNLLTPLDFLSNFTAILTPEG